MAGIESADDDFLAIRQEEALPSPSLQAPSISPPGEDAAPSKRKSKKIKSAELEEMHAASQRLLRESPSASFKPLMTSGKSVTSVLEKIRLRKKQLVQGKRSAFSVLPDVADSLEIVDEELSFARCSASQALNVINVEDTNKREHGITLCIDTNDEIVCEEDDMASLPEEHAEQAEIGNKSPKVLAEGHESDDVGKSTYPGSGNAFRLPMEDTQDLLSPSDDDLEENLNLDKEDETFGGSRVTLQLDTETQDDYADNVHEDAYKENVEPTSLDGFPNKQIFKGPSVRALIDDEAEDEDEDEDILFPGEDDEADEGEDLDDMVVEETDEKLMDKEKRAELHSKWLEQQDAVMTDDILLRLKTGWRPHESRKRGYEFLDEELEFTQKEGAIEESPDVDEELHEIQESPHDNSVDEETFKDDVDPDGAKAFRSFEDLNDVHESSDDEETEQRMMRQRFLEESDAQRDFISPADDETSREIFGLINKVNIASSNKKLKNGSLSDLRYLSGGSSNSSSSFTAKSSFLRRTVSSTFGSVQRRGSSGSVTRSFIFGRDDSNSSHSFDQHVDMSDMKENIEPAAQVLRKGGAQTRYYGQGKDNSKATKPSATQLGPSLFEILRRQSTDMDKTLQKNSLKEGSHSMSPIFVAFKPIKPISTARGGHRT